MRARLQNRWLIVLALGLSCGCSNWERPQKSRRTNNRGVGPPIDRAVSMNAEGSGLAYETYIWQRQWTDGLREAIREHGDEFAKLVVLGGEISFVGSAPHVVRTEIDHAVLQKSNRRVGIALRIGSFGGPFEANDEHTRLVCEVASRSLRTAEDAGINVAELQIDFDCATSKLNGYVVWLKALKLLIGDVPLTITALPTWLDSADFSSLAKATEGFVLQVHSLERPSQSSEQLALCNPSPHFSQK